MHTENEACVCSVASVLRPYGLEPTRPLCSWDTLGKNTGVHCHALLPASSQPRDGTHVSCVSCTGKLVLYHWCLPGATSDKIKGNFTKIEQQDQNGELSDTWKSIDIPVPRNLLCTSRRNQHYFTEATGGRKISWCGNSSASEPVMTQPTENHSTCNSVCVLVTQSCPALYSPWPGFTPGSSVRGVLQAECWNGVHFLGVFPTQGPKPRSSALQADALLPELLGHPFLNFSFPPMDFLFIRFLPTSLLFYKSFFSFAFTGLPCDSHSWKKMKVEVAQSCPTVQSTEFSRPEYWSG